MSYYRQSSGASNGRRTNGNVNVPSAFDRPKQNDIDKFKSKYPDGNDVRDFAEGVRRLGEKYREVEDDYELCIVYLREQRLESIDENVKLIIPTISLVGSPVFSHYPITSTIATGLISNSPRLSKWFINIYEPELSIRDRSDEENAFIPLPRDEETISGIKKVFKDCKVPAPIASSFVEMFSDGFGMKAVLTGVRAVAIWFRPVPVDSSGFDSQTSDYI